MGIVVSDFSRCVPVSEWETGWCISGHSGDVGFGSPCLTFPSAGSDRIRFKQENSFLVSAFNIFQEKFQRCQGLYDPRKQSAKSTGPNRGEISRCHELQQRTRNRA